MSRLKIVKLGFKKLVQMVNVLWSWSNNSTNLQFSCSRPSSNGETDSAHCIENRVEAFWKLVDQNMSCKAATWRKLVNPNCNSSTISYLQKYTYFEFWHFVYQVLKAFCTSSLLPAFSPVLFCKVVKDCRYVFCFHFLSKFRIWTRTKTKLHYGLRVVDYHAQAFHLNQIVCRSYDVPLKYFQCMARSRSIMNKSLVVSI